MSSNHLIQTYVQQLQLPAVTPTIGKALLATIDLTDLATDSHSANLPSLCHKANSPYGTVAAICINQPLVAQAKHILKNSPVKIATVANFPGGNEPIANIIASIENALIQGATEIDVVFPYQRFLAGDRISPFELIAVCKETCGKYTLKVILETGAFTDLEHIYEAALGAIDSGADFLKTSTGKITHGATFEAAATLLVAIRETDRQVGFKASGGIRTLEQAVGYWQLAKNIMGSEWVTPVHFRLGTSQLLDTLITFLTNPDFQPTSTNDEC